jgi:hypothetical protein
MIAQHLCSIRLRNPPLRCYYMYNSVFRVWKGYGEKKRTYRNTNNAAAAFRTEKGCKEALIAQFPQYLSSPIQLWRQRRKKKWIQAKPSCSFLHICMQQCHSTSMLARKWDGELSLKPHCPFRVCSSLTKHGNFRRDEPDYVVLVRKQIHPFTAVWLYHAPEWIWYMWIKMVLPTTHVFR